MDLIFCLVSFAQGGYNPFVGQQYLQIYGVPGSANPTIYHYGQLGQTVPGGHGYGAVHGYAMPSPQILQFSGPNVNALTSSPMPTIQAPYPSGILLCMQIILDCNIEQY